MVAPVSHCSSSILPDSQLIDPLRVPRRTERSSGFRGVYWFRKDDDGRDVWVAKIKLGGSLVYGVSGVKDVKRSRGGGKPIGYSTLPHVCAKLVAQKYAETFGENWRQVVAARKLTPWQVRHSAAFGGFVAAVWVAGRREEVVELKQRSRAKAVVAGEGAAVVAYRRWCERKPDCLAVFATPEAAKVGIADYMARLYGPEWRRLLYRTARATSAVPAPATPGTCPAPRGV